MNLHSVNFNVPIADRILIHEYLAARFTGFHWTTTERGWEYRAHNSEPAYPWMQLTFEEAQNRYLDRAILFRSTGEIQ